MKNSDEQLTELAALVQKECINAAREGFQDASMSGLCTEGAIEAAIGAMQSIDLEKLIQKFAQ